MKSEPTGEATTTRAMARDVLPPELIQLMGRSSTARGLTNRDQGTLCGTGRKNPAASRWFSALAWTPIVGEARDGRFHHGHGRPTSPDLGNLRMH